MLGSLVTPNYRSGSWGNREGHTFVPKPAGMLDYFARLNCRYNCSPFRFLTECLAKLLMLT